MVKVVIDLEKIKRPNSGLGQFCLHLSKEIVHSAKATEIGVYLPKDQFNLFPNQERIAWKSIHKLVGVNVKTKLWHSFHQEAVYFPKDKSVKRILTIHDLNFLANYTGKKQLKMLERLQHLVNQSSVVTFISNYTETIAKQHLKFPTSTVTKVISNGIALDLTVKAQKPTWIDSSSPFLFSIGIIGEKKNFHVLIEMMLYLPELKLYISGKKDSTYAKTIVDLIAAFGLTNRVLLSGEVSEAEKIWLYKNCSAFVFPSKNEGFGLPVVEAMSFGKPLVLSRLTSLPEIGGELADYFSDFEPENMAKIVKESINKHTLLKKQELQQRASLFSWNKAAKGYLAIYTNLLKES